MGTIKVKLDKAAYHKGESSDSWVDEHNICRFVRTNRFGKWTWYDDEAFDNSPEDDEDPYTIASMFENDSKFAICDTNWNVIAYSGNRYGNAAFQTPTTVANYKLLKYLDEHHIKYFECVSDLYEKIRETFGRFEWVRDGETKELETYWYLGSPFTIVRDSCYNPLHELEWSKYYVKGACGYRPLVSKR